MNVLVVYYAKFVFRAGYHLKRYVLVKDGFGENGKQAIGNEGEVPPNGTRKIPLELVSWKIVSNVTIDKRVVKKILKRREGYERPNE